MKEFFYNYRSFKSPIHINRNGYSVQSELRNGRSDEYECIDLKERRNQKVIDMREVIEEVRKVYKLKSQGKTVIWPLVNYEFEEEHAAMDIRSGYVKGEQASWTENAQ